MEFKWFPEIDNVSFGNAFLMSIQNDAFYKST